MVCEHELWHMKTNYIDLKWSQIHSQSTLFFHIFLGGEPPDTHQTVIKYYSELLWGKPHGHVSTSDIFIDPKWSQIHSENT